MSAYTDLLGLAKRARTGLFHVPVPRAWDTAASSPLARPAAVLLLFGVLDDVHALSTIPVLSADLDVLLVERAATLSDHPGQVAFPGGGVEAADVSFVAAALREAVEETGLDPAGVEILGELPRIPVPVSNFIVTPVLGWWASRSPVGVVDYAESAQVFRVPVRDLLDPGNRFTATLERGGRSYRGPAFVVNGVVVWGFTAGILDHLFDELGWSVSWDESREILAPL